uniref:Type IV pilus assembly PilZ n=1 Tax=Rhodopseudomonas palustris (strain BisA53) TaxID=316055 RepID=Q07QE0_RHOP5
MVSVEKFFKQRAVNIVVGGHYTLANWYDAHGKPRSFACRTRRISPFRMMVDVPVVGRLGDSITSYFGDFGQLEGRITDTVAGSFLLELDMTGEMRRRMADQLSWLEKKLKDPSVRDERKHARIVPATPHSTLTFGDGATRSCFVIDMSVSGAAISADVQPEIGTPLAVGAAVGRVVRHRQDGFAVSFVEPQRLEELERRIICRPAELGPRQAKASLRPHARRAVVEPPTEEETEVYYLDA